MSGLAISPVQLACLALDYLGQKPISSISPPSTNLETLVARWYDIVRQGVLRKYTIWNFAKTEAQVSLVSTTTVGTTVTAAAITGITQALAGVVTAPNHGFTSGQQISVTGVVGMTQINTTQALGNYYTVNVLDSNTFNLVSLSGSIINTVGFGAYVSGGICTPSIAVPIASNLTSDFENFYQLPQDFIRLLSVGGDIEVQQLLASDYDLRNGFLCTGSYSSSSSSSSVAPATMNIRYIKDVKDLSLWDPVALNVFALELALRLAFPVTKDKDIVKNIEALLEKELPDATSVDGQEKPPLRIQRSNILEARRSGVVTNPQYYFPPNYGY